MWSGGYLGGKKPKKQDNSNVSSDNKNEALFHTVILAWEFFFHLEYLGMVDH